MEWDGHQVRRLLRFVLAVIFAMPGNVEPSNLQTLRTYETQVCDGSELSLECLSNTVISVYRATYGRRAPQLCLGSLNDTTTPLAGSCQESINVLQRVEGECKNKHSCSLPVTPDFLGEGPCPGEPQHLDVSYKCRPNKFFHKLACDGDKLRLRCPKEFRVVIYSAAYGATRKGVQDCPQSRSREECQATLVTEAVIRACHGRRKCALDVDLETLGDPGCRSSVRPFLKVIYTCVPQEALVDQEEPQEEEGEEQDNKVELSFGPPHYSGITEADTPSTSSSSTQDFWGRESTDDDGMTQLPPRPGSSRPPPKIATLGDDAMDDPVDINCTQPGDSRMAGFLSEWISAYTFIKGNKERFFLYLTLSITTGILLFLVVLSARLYCQHRRNRKHAKLSISEPYASEHYTPGERLDAVAVEGVRYTPTNRTTLRRQQQLPDGGLSSSPRTAHTNSYYS